MLSGEPLSFPIELFLLSQLTFADYDASPRYLGWSAVE